VIAVVVGAKDGRQPPSIAREQGEDGFGIARIDYGYPVGGFAAEQPDIVVLESADV